MSRALKTLKELFVYLLYVVAMGYKLENLCAGEWDINWKKFRGKSYFDRLYHICLEGLR
jgi:hypothetical protein